jgi:predicted RNase H-like HicB family nuclease
VPSYIALLRKDARSHYGVEFPDFPGCVTAGRTLDEARTMAEEALALHLAGLVEDGEKVPAPRALEAALAGEDLRGAVPFLVSVREPEARVVRVNVTFKPEVLDALDAEAERAGTTRSGLLEAAVLERVRRPPRKARPRAPRKAARR